MTSAIDVINDVYVYSDAVSEAPAAEDRSYPARPFLAVSVAVFREGKVLIAERMKPPMTGIFTLPGGMVEAGEQLEAAALRELQEETGLDAELVGFTRHVEIIDRDLAGRVRFHAVVCPFAARFVSGDPVANAEIGRLLFIDPSEIAQYPTTQGLGEIIRSAGLLLG
jgi:8-oxo-dGTP diphosphatase